MVPPITFQDVTAQAGISFTHVHGGTGEKYLVETMGGGAAFLDYNHDGLLDLYLVNGGVLPGFTPPTPPRNALYRNNGDGTFTDVTEKAGVGNPLWSASCAFADVDGDGDLDLFVVNYVDFTLDNHKFCGDRRTKVRAYCSPQVYSGLPNALYRNNGDGTFTEITREAGLFTTEGKGLGVVFGDYDNDGDLDLYVANDSTRNFLYRNKDHGIFEEVGLPAGVAYGPEGKAEAGMGVDFGDYDNDGFLDIVVTNLAYEGYALYHNNGDGTFTDIRHITGLGQASLMATGWGVGFFDFDNDGDLDLLGANGHTLDNQQEVYVFEGAGVELVPYAQRNLLLRNNGDGTFTDISGLVGEAFRVGRVGRGVAFGDYDNDGDIDMLIVNSNSPPTLLRNDGGNRNHWLMVKAIGTTSNRDGIGARITVVTGPSVQIREIKGGGSYLSQNDPRAHFGLGASRKVDLLEIRWPSGIVDRIRDIEANRLITVTEGQGLAHGHGSGLR